MGINKENYVDQAEQVTKSDDRPQRKYYTDNKQNS